jgi:hypothetical protein
MTIILSLALIVLGLWALSCVCLCVYLLATSDKPKLAFEVSLVVFGAPFFAVYDWLKSLLMKRKDDDR